VKVGVKRIEVCYIYMFYDTMMKPTEHCLGMGGRWREHNRGGELVQYTLYASMESSQ
jgi:hypothetical protein